MPDNTGGDAGAHEDDLKVSNTEFGRDRDLFFFRMSSQQTNFLVIPCLLTAHCSFVTVPSTFFYAAVMSPSPLVNIETVTILSLDSGLGSSKSVFLSDFNRMVASAIQVVGIQRLKDILSIPRMNLRS